MVNPYRIEDFSYPKIYVNFSIFSIPQYGNTLNSGTNFVISCCQLCNVDAGVTTKMDPTYYKFQLNANTDIL